MPPIRALAAAALAAATLLLSSCMVLPGKFGSELNLRGDGSFAFAYKGDIHLVALSKMGRDEDATPFTPQPCTDEESGEERECRADELAVQRQEWEETAKANAEKRKQDAESMKRLLGGIDPSDPKAAEEFASRLRRQVGWKSVVDRGDGRFEVEFAIAGRLDHDFSFPTLERMPVVSPFVTVVRRSDGTVRVEAPAFAAGQAGGPLADMMNPLGGGSSGPDGLPELDGTFTLVTDGEILANNTDEGPKPGTTGKRLEWKVGPRTQSPPSALVRLAR